MLAPPETTDARTAPAYHGIAPGQDLAKAPYDAVKAFIGAMYDRAYGLAYKVPFADREDVAEEALVRIVGGWRSVEGDPDPWVNTIVRNEVARYFAKRSREVPTVHGADAVAAAQLLVDAPEEVHDDKPLREVLAFLDGATPEARATTAVAKRWQGLKRSHAKVLLVHLSLAVARVIYLRVVPASHPCPACTDRMVVETCRRCHGAGVVPTLLNEEVAEAEGVAEGTACDRYWQGMRELQALLEKRGLAGLMPAFFAWQLRLPGSHHPAPGLVDRLLAEMGHHGPPSTPPPSTPPPSGRPAEPNAWTDPDEPGPPSGPRPLRWTSRLAERIGSAIVGGGVVALLLMGPAHKRDGRPAPASMAAIDPGGAAEVPEVAAAPAERVGPPASAPRERVPSAPLPSAGGESDDAALRLYNRALHAHDTQNYDEALRWLMEHRALYPNKMPRSRERLLRLVCDALKASGSSDPRCP